MCFEVKAGKEEQNSLKYMVKCFQVNQSATNFKSITLDAQAVNLMLATMSLIVFLWITKNLFDVCSVFSCHFCKICPKWREARP